MATKKSYSAAKPAAPSTPAPVAAPSAPAGAPAGEQTDIPVHSHARESSRGLGEISAHGSLTPSMQCGWGEIRRAGWADDRMIMRR